MEPFNSLTFIYFSQPDVGMFGQLISASGRLRGLDVSMRRLRQRIEEDYVIGII